MRCFPLCIAVSCRTFLSLFFMLNLVSASSPASAEIYYVSTSGADTNSGASDSPWFTIQKACDTMVAGDTVLIADGEYTGRVVQRRSGEPGAPITIKAINRGGVTILGNVAATYRDEVHINQAHWIVIDGLTVVNAERGIRVDRANNCVVRHCRVFNSLTQGIFTNYSDDTTLEYNECAYTQQQHGIYVSNGGDRPIVRYNVSHDNARVGIQLNGDREQINPDYGTRGDGIHKDAVIVGNIVYNNGNLDAGAGLNLLSVHTSLIANNLIYNNLAGGIAMSNDTLAIYTEYGSKNNRIYNNTIYFRPGEGRWCISTKRGSDGNLIYNNILYGGLKGAYEYDDSSINVSDYNLLPSADSTKVATNADVAAFYTLGEWQALTGNDQNSSQADPRFLSALSEPYDFRVHMDSPAVHAGILYSDVPTDIEGAIRPAGPSTDIGCYQVGPKIWFFVAGRALFDEQGIAGITISSGGVAATSAEDGSYTLGPLRAGTYEVRGASSEYVCMNPPSVTVGPDATSVDLSMTALLSTLSVEPGQVEGAAGATGTITLAAAAPEGGTVISLGSSSGSVTVPPSVTVSAGETAATFSIVTSAVAEATIAEVTATLGSTTRLSMLTVTSPRVLSLSLSPETVEGGSSSTAALTLSSPAPTGGATVSLEADHGVVTLPLTVTVPAGETNITFDVTTTAVSQDVSVTISATLGSSAASAGLTVTTPSLQSVSVDPVSVVGGEITTGTVTLSRAAPAGGMVVMLSSDASAASVPTSITIAEGATSGEFTVQTSPVASETSVTLTATIGSQSASATLTVKAASVSSVSLSPASVTGGSSSTFAVILTGAAPSGGAAVSLTSNNTAATVPANINVPEGQTSASVNVDTATVTSDTSAGITATYNDTSASATLSIKPLRLATLTITPTSVKGGASATGTVTLTGKAAAGGTVVALSTDQGLAKPPATVTVPAGSTSASFTIATKKASRNTVATITATLGDSTLKATVTVLK